jgi:hypothetical protein
MSLNPDGAPAYSYQAGATAYLMDPAGAYSPAGPSAPTIDPAFTDDGAGAGASAPTLAAAGVYIPIAGATSAAEIGDPEVAYSLTSAGASPPTTDPAGADGGAGASVPTLAAAGAYIPITEATSAAEIVDPEGVYSLAGASAPTDPVGRRSAAGASAPTLAAQGTYIPVTGATTAAAEIGHAGAYSLTGVRAATIEPAGRDSAAGAGAPMLAATIDPGGAPPGYYYDAAANSYVKDPPGTYSTGGATLPIADPGGTYSAAGASAPTTDPAGTYSSPYALNRLVIVGSDTTPANAVLSFQSITAVANYYGATSPETSLAKEFFATKYAGAATMLFTRFGLGQRPHLLGANISNLTLTPGPNSLQNISGSIAITFDGYNYSGNVDLEGAMSLVGAAHNIQNALNSNLQVAAVTAGGSITRESVSFMGYVDHQQLYVTSVSSGTIEIGGIVSGRGVKSGSQIIGQRSGTPGSQGQYSFFASSRSFSIPEAMTETYGVLTVGAVNSGSVALGQEVTGAGVLPLTAIDTNLSGSGPGSTWVVNNAPAQTVTGGMTMTAPPLTVANQSFVGATENNDFFEIQPNGSFGFDQNPSSLSYMSGTAADALGLTQASGAIDSTPGGQHPSTAQYMNNIVQNETDQFGNPVQLGSFQTAETKPGVSASLGAWAQSIDGNGYQFLTPHFTSPPAGSSLPTTDPAGTYSLPDASAPTPAPAGYYIPVAGATSPAAEVQAQPGYYVPTQGASFETPAQPGYYVNTLGAISETLDPSGTYTPNAGMTAPLPVLAPVISGTGAQQSIQSGQTDTPFSNATITDSNINTTDSLSIQITGGGGKLSGSGLERGAAGVYILSGTAAAITQELEALVFTPNNFSATTTFTLTDTTSADVDKSAVDANTTVAVTNGEPVYLVSYFLANQSTLDQIPGGFSILDTATKISASLHQLHDSHIQKIVISDNGNVGASIQKLTTNATAIGKLQNANRSRVRLAITDTATDIENGLSTLVQDAGEIASITASNGPVVVSVATLLADRSTLDKIVGGFVVKDMAANMRADLNQLNDPNISAITISDNGQITASVAQLTADATAIGKLENENGSRVLLLIRDTAGAVQTGLATVIQDTGEIGSISITTPNYPVVVSTETFQTDQSTLDKIVGGFDVADDAAKLVAALPALNADPGGVDAITAEIGAATLSGIAGVNAPSFSESGWATSLTVSEVLAYAGTFIQGPGSTTTITAEYSLSLTGTASLSGTTSGAGTLALEGSATIDKGATISVSNWSISGAGKDVTLAENLNYAGSFTFSEGADDTLVLSGGHLLLNGAATFAGGTVDGSNTLYTAGTTTVAGLTIGGTVALENTKTINQSGGNVTLGDNIPADAAILFNTSLATYDILDDSGIGLGASTASYIHNTGLLEKTGGTATSTLAPSVTNTGTIEVTAGTLDLQGQVSGKGKDEISGSSTLEFDSTVAADQTVSFARSGGTLDLGAPQGFAGQISGFDTVGAGSSDTIEFAGLWVFSSFKENAGGTQGTLRLLNGANTLSLTLLGNYNPNPADWVLTHAKGSTLLTYNPPVPGLDSLQLSAGSARGEWGAGDSWQGSVGHGPGPS